MDENNLLRALLLVGDDDDEDDGDVSGNNDSDSGNEDNGGRWRLIVDVEKWKRLGDPTFKQHFRMNRFTFERLVVVVGQHMVATHRMVRQGVAIDVSLMMTLWILATTDTFRSVGVKFGLLGGSIHNQYKTMISVLKELKDRFIQWPSDFEKEAIARQFEVQYGYPGCIGCIDGCHIRITAPLEQPQMYVSHHRDYSILLQAVCDNRLLFRDVYVGQPGSVGDVRMFHRSPLSKKILGLEHIMGDFHLLGDGAYPCTYQCLSPFRDYGNLTRRQRTHNHILSRCRSSIERAFALLKGKWRRLKLLNCYCMDYAVDNIMASLVLHNFIILEGQEYEVIHNDAEIVWQPGQYEQMFEESKVRGVMKRDYIAATLIQEQL